MPKKRLTIAFVVENEAHVDGAWEYTISVHINNREFGIGKANAKKQAEQLAAKQTMDLIGEI